MRLPTVGNSVWFFVGNDHCSLPRRRQQGEPTAPRPLERSPTVRLRFRVLPVQETDRRQSEVRGQRSGRRSERSGTDPGHRVASNGVASWNGHPVSRSDLPRQYEPRLGRGELVDPP